MSRIAYLLLPLLIPSLALTDPVEIPVREVGAALLQNVPPIPPDVSAAVQRYQGFRDAELHGWLADGSLLITTRFGQTVQVHRVVEPGSAREQLTFFADAVEDAIPIPGTSRFIVERDTNGDEWFQLFVAGAGEPPTQLTDPGTRNEWPVLSHDGRLLAWSRAVKGSGAYAILTANPLEPDSASVVHESEGRVQTADVSPDRKSVLFLSVVSNHESRVQLLDLASGSVRELSRAAEPALYLDPAFTRDGRAVIAITDAASDVLRLVEIDLDSGKHQPLTPDLEWDVEEFELSPDGRVLAYAINEDGYSRVVVQDRVKRRALPQPDLPRGVMTQLAFSPDGRQFGVSLTTPTIPGDVWSWDLTDHELTRWTYSELGDLDPAALVEPQLIRYRSFDELEVPAFVYRPRGAKPATPTPVIIDIHGGPESQTQPRFNPGAQYFTAMLGATVIQPNVRGSTGYGKHYARLDNAEKREDSVRDIGALLDWIATQPGLDAGRVAVYGQSYGGYMSLASMTHYADRLVGGVERYGISDFATFLENTESYRRDHRRGEYGDERDSAMRKVFERIAPLANVAKITKPMLVMQGANDPRVPQSESDQVVAGIRRNGVEVWYVVFADEGHGFRKKANNDLRHEIETVFLRERFGLR
jgi:dipeptidyl aminopeptidase/acylaminoacyl peptidase